MRDVIHNRAYPHKHKTVSIIIGHTQYDHPMLTPCSYLLKQIVLGKVKHAKLAYSMFTYMHSF